MKFLDMITGKSGIKKEQIRQRWKRYENSDLSTEERAFVEHKEVTLTPKPTSTGSKQMSNAAHSFKAKSPKPFNMQPKGPDVFGFFGALNRGGLGVSRPKRRRRR